MNLYCLFSLHVIIAKIFGYVLMVFLQVNLFLNLASMCILSGQVFAYKVTACCASSKSSIANDQEMSLTLCAIYYWLSCMCVPVLQVVLFSFHDYFHKYRKKMEYWETCPSLN